MANLNNVEGFTCENLNERITIMRCAVTVDTAGNRLRNYVPYKSVWANVQAIGSINSGEKSIEVKRVINYSIVVRLPLDLKLDDRILWQGITLRQTTAAVPVGRKFLVISAKDLRENV